MPLVGDGRSGTFSALPGQYGGYKSGTTGAPSAYVVAPSRRVLAAGNPPTATLTDDFATLDSAKWTFAGNASLNSGRLQLSTSTTYQGARTVNAYDLTNSSASVELVQAAGPGNGTVNTSFYLQVDANNSVAFTLEANELFFQRFVGGVFVDPVATIAYNATNHRFLRFLHDGTSIQWQTSADGTSWSVVSTWTPTIRVTAVKPYLETGYSGTEPSPGVALFDNFNLSGAASETHTTSGTATATASASGSSTTTRTKTATGSATASASGTTSSIRTKTAAALAAATATRTGSSTRTKTGTATATATASGATTATRPKSGTAATTATASGVTASQRVKTGTATATATATRTTATTRVKTGTAPATATATGTTSSSSVEIHTTTGTASATATASATKSTTRTTARTATATATASRVGTSTRTTARTATATATASGATSGIKRPAGTATLSAGATALTTTQRVTVRTALAHATASGITVQPGAYRDITLRWQPPRTRSLTGTATTRSLTGDLQPWMSVLLVP